MIADLDRQKIQQQSEEILFAESIKNLPDLLNFKDPEYLRDTIFNSTLLDLPYPPYSNDLLDQMSFEDPTSELLLFMSNPENFWYTCKHLLNVDHMPFQVAILREMWCRKFPMLIATRGAGKTFLLAIYAILRALFHQGCKVVVVGAAFRQSKLIFEYMEQVYRRSPVFRHLVSLDVPSTKAGPKRDIDRCTFMIGQSEITAIPLGDGSKIRGLRANYVLADEFASLPLEVFEVVIKGFTSVSASPQQRAADLLRVQMLQGYGLTEEAQDVADTIGMGNQTVVSGTAYYAFNHFYEYWKRYKAIVESMGEQRKLEEVFLGKVPDAFDWTQFSVMRVPFNRIPRGFMDEVQIAQAKATMHSSVYVMEYEACFARDSEGFFRRSLVESCVANDQNNISLPSGLVKFTAAIKGSPNLKYVFGIDPASESDNFAIVVIELHEDHRRIVYSWTVNREVLRERLRNRGQTNERSYYNYCARKIRELLKVFPSDHIAVDTQGGGIAIMEALHDAELLHEGELPIWPYIKKGDDDPCWWEQKDKPTDGQPGLHILHMVQFANAQFNNEANHDLRKDFENKVALFPFFDSAEIGRAIEVDKKFHREYDTLEDCVLEIEALKDELAMIQHDQTTGGRDRWDTPEVKKPGGKVGRLRKDRYSALIIANKVARSLVSQLANPEYHAVGGCIGKGSKREAGGSYSGGKMYVGPEHIVNKMTGVYGVGLRR
jgi:hypothetical protein